VPVHFFSGWTAVGGKADSMGAPVPCGAGDRASGGLERDLRMACIPAGKDNSSLTKFPGTNLTSAQPVDSNILGQNERCFRTEVPPPRHARSNVSRFQAVSGCKRRSGRAFAGLLCQYLEANHPEESPHFYEWLRHRRVLYCPKDKTKIPEP